MWKINMILITNKWFLVLSQYLLIKWRTMIKYWLNFQMHTGFLIASITHWPTEICHSLCIGILSSLLGKNNKYFVTVAPHDTFFFPPNSHVIYRLHLTPAVSRVIRAERENFVKIRHISEFSEKKMFLPQTFFIFELR